VRAAEPVRYAGLTMFQTTPFAKMLFIAVAWPAAALAHGDERSDRLLGLTQAFDDHYEAGRSEHAERAGKPLLEFGEWSYPDQPLTIAVSLKALAKTNWAQTRYREAEPYCTRSLAIKERTMGRDDLEVAATLARFSELYHLLGRYDDGEPPLRRLLAIRKKQERTEHPAVADVQTDMGSTESPYYWATFVLVRPN